jgi:hypothetical protein
LQFFLVCAKYSNFEELEFYCSNMLCKTDDNVLKALSLYKKQVMTHDSASSEIASVRMTIPYASTLVKKPTKSDMQNSRVFDPGYGLLVKTPRR